MQTIVLNTEQKPIREKHVAFFTSQSESDITVCEVVEAFYPHPTGKEFGLEISRLETRRGKTENITSSRSAPIQLIQLADKNLEEIRNRYFFENT